jgi:multidrug resistance protein, MATE family
MSIFIGTASFTGTFVAQYYGAQRYERIGAVLWQGVYLSLIGGALILLLFPLAGPLFTLIGHDPSVRVHEVAFFRILCLGAAPAIASSALSGFFSGRGVPWPIMWLSAGQTVVTVVLDYVLIFGRWGCPEMGIAGAAWATVISGYLSFAGYVILLSRKHYNETYGILRARRFDRELFARFIRYGLPNGLQFFIDMAGFTLFILLVGRLGTIPLAATNIAFNINTLAFMPMLGIGLAVSILVGQNLGRDDPAMAERSVYSGFDLTFVYMAVIALLYVIVPDLFLQPFSSKIHPGHFGEVHRIGIVLLRFVAFYSLFDTMNIIFSAALKGAGDTRYVMSAVAVLSAFVLVIPAYLVIVVFHAGVYAAWTIMTTYAIALGYMFYFRFRHGRWKHMRVIEPAAIPNI